jgi:GT2 family glycosyltransferase
VVIELDEDRWRTIEVKVTIQVSVIVLVWNGEKFLDACLSALLAQDYSPFEVIVVDNASSDNSVKIVQGYEPRVRLIRNDYNLGFAGGNNVGLKVANGDIVVLLNQDTVVQPGWLRAIVETFDDPTIGIVGCKALYPDGRGFQHAGGMVDPACAFTRHIGWGEVDTGQYDSLSEPDYVTGAAFAIHRKVLLRLGGLDEQFYPAFFEEVDYCYRARRAGFHVVYQPRACLYHHETASLPADGSQRGLTYHRNRIRFLLRHWSREAFDSFARAESQGIQDDLALDDVVARARAYWDNLLALPIIFSQRRADVTLGGALLQGEFRWLVETLQSLRQQALDRIVALSTKSVAPSANERDASVSAIPAVPVANPQTLIQELGQAAVLQEPRLHSKVPMFGWLINGFRFLWIALIGRHYIVPILNQQSAFNDRLTELLREQAEWHEREMLTLREEIAVLRQEEATLRQEIAMLRQQADVAERIQQILRVDEAAIPHALQMIGQHFQDSRKE